jgi:hypothetical protein
MKASNIFSFSELQCFPVLSPSIRDPNDTFSFVTIVHQSRFSTVLAENSNSVLVSMPVAFLAKRVPKRLLRQVANVHNMMSKSWSKMTVQEVRDLFANHVLCPECNSTYFMFQIRVKGKQAHQAKKRTVQDNESDVESLDSDMNTQSRNPDTSLLSSSLLCPLLLFCRRQ